MTILNPITLSSLYNSQVALQFVLPGLLKGTVGGINSPGGVGKSFWALQLALEKSGCLPMSKLTGLAPSRGRVVLCNAEDPEEILASRIQSIMSHEPSALDILATNESQFSIYALAGKPSNIMEKAFFEALKEDCNGAELIILDTLRRFHMLDENSTSDMTRVMARLEELAFETKAAVLYIHHSSKAAVLAGQATLAQGSRGSSVLVDNARWVSFLAPLTKEDLKLRGITDTESTYVRWNISKQNYGSPIDDIIYQRTNGGVLVAQSQLAETPLQQQAISTTRKAVIEGSTAVSAPETLPLDLNVTDNIPVSATTIARPATKAAAKRGAVLTRATMVPSLPSANNMNNGNW